MNKSEKKVLFGSKVDLLRSEIDLSLREIASELGLEYETLKNYKYGRQKIPDNTLKSLDILIDRKGLTHVGQINKDKDSRYLLELIEAKDHTIRTLESQVSTLQDQVNLLKSLLEK